MMTIGENLKKLRKNAGFTQKQLAEEIGIKQCTLSQLERNEKPLSLSMSIEVAGVLKCSLYDLAENVDAFVE